jgi:hypothetical protein
MPRGFSRTVDRTYREWAARASMTRRSNSPGIR